MNAQSTKALLYIDTVLLPSNPIIGVQIDGGFPAKKLTQAQSPNVTGITERNLSWNKVSRSHLVQALAQIPTATATGSKPQPATSTSESSRKQGGWAKLEKSVDFSLPRSPQAPALL